MRIRWSEPAIADLSAIHDYTSQDAPGRADRFVQRLIAAAEPLGEFPSLGRLVPEGDGQYREGLFDPYRILYEATETEIFIVAVVHGARDLARLLNEEK